MKAADGIKLAVDVLLPKDRSSNAPLPCVLFQARCAIPEGGRRPAVDLSSVLEKLHFSCTSAAALHRINSRHLVCVDAPSFC